MNLTHPAPVQVLFLGPLREQVGLDFIEVSCPPDGSQIVFWEFLREKLPELTFRPGSLRLARHDEFLSASEVLRPGDKLAIVPPVSGG